MARNQSGGFNKFLNFIGLVEDGRDQGPMADEYTAGDYGRPSTYVPTRQRGEEPRRSAPPPAQMRLPSQAGRSNYGSRRTYGEEEPPRYQPQRSSRYEEAPEYEPPRRPRSRFEEPEEPMYDEPAPRSAPQRRRSSGRGERTSILNLVTLKDANVVIKELVRDNTVIMTIETADERLRERIIDTICGAVYALDADIHRASGQTYIVTPKSANVKDFNNPQD